MLRMVFIILTDAQMSRKGNSAKRKSLREKENKDIDTVSTYVYNADIDMVSIDLYRETGEKTMKYTKLGNSDLNVSRICMGCMGFGDSGRGQHSWTIDEEHTREIIRRGLEHTDLRYSGWAEPHCEGR